MAIEILLIIYDMVYATEIPARLGKIPPSGNNALISGIRKRAVKDGAPVVRKLSLIEIDPTTRCPIFFTALLPTDVT